MNIHLMPARSVFILFLFLLLSARGSGQIDGLRAMEHIKQQCRFGPRIPGTKAHLSCRDWIAGQLEKLDLKVRIEPLEVTLPCTGNRTTAFNIWGTCKNDRPASPTLMISAHWDTRPFADRDPNTTRRRETLAGANDGASGVALALELFNGLKQSPFSDNIVLVFWDVEDAGNYKDPRSWALGSAHAAGQPPDWINQVVLGINLDMVAGRDLYLAREKFSMDSAPDIVRDIWALGGTLAPNLFDPDNIRQVQDDHVPWINAGIPYVDIIGIPYRHWHTTRDTPANCSSEILEGVGNVLLNYVLYGDWPRWSRQSGLREGSGEQ
jgi:glutaminyl-peptide cyclotransferase